jgi:hypothetical protein
MVDAKSSKEPKPKVDAKPTKEPKNGAELIKKSKVGDKYLCNHENMIIEVKMYLSLSFMILPQTRHCIREINLINS